MSHHRYHFATVLFLNCSSFYICMITVLCVFINSFATIKCRYLLVKLNCQFLLLIYVSFVSNKLLTYLYIYLLTYLLTIIWQYDNMRKEQKHL